MPAHKWSRRQALAMLSASVAATASRPGLAVSDDAPMGGWMPADAPLQETFSLSNATLLRHDGTRLQGGVRVENGIIVELGAGVTGGEDLGGAWIVPGFTDSGCLLGLVEVWAVGSTQDTTVSGDAVTVDARVIDGYNPLSDVIPTTRVNGITHALLHPATNHLVTGQAAVVQLAGLTRTDATVQSPSAVCINLGNAGRGEGLSSRIAVMRRLRQLLDKASSPTDVDSEDEDKYIAEDEQIWQAVLAGEQKVLIKAERLDDIHAALDVLDHYALNGVLLGCAEGHLAAQRIADAGVPVLLGPLNVQPSSFEHPHAIYENAQILHAAGVKLGMRSAEVHNSRQLPTFVGMAVAHGLPFEAGIAALTSNPGDILGLGEHHGRLQVGAPGTFFQVPGDPLQPRFAVQRMWINGRRTSMETRQTRLFERFQDLP